MVEPKGLANFAGESLLFEIVMSVLLCLVWYIELTPRVIMKTVKELLVVLSSRVLRFSP